MAMNTENLLVKYDAARKALAEAHEIDEVKGIRDATVALRAYAVQAKDVQMQNWASEIRIRAERRAGEMLREMEKQHGSRGVGKKVESPKAIPLSELGITPTQSSYWQKLAEPEEKVFEQALLKITGAGKELTTAAVMRETKPPEPEPKLKQSLPTTPSANNADWTDNEYIQTCVGFVESALKPLESDPERFVRVATAIAEEIVGDRETQ